MSRLAEGTRRAAKAWGLNLLCKNPRWYSDSLTVIEVPEVGSCSLSAVPHLQGLQRGSHSAGLMPACTRSNTCRHILTCSPATKLVCYLDDALQRDTQSAGSTAPYQQHGASACRAVGSGRSTLHSSASA